MFKHTMSQGGPIRGSSSGSPRRLPTCVSRWGPGKIMDTGRHRTRARHGTRIATGHRPPQDTGPPRETDCHRHGPTTGHRPPQDTGPPQDMGLPQDTGHHRTQAHHEIWARHGTQTRHRTWAATGHGPTTGHRSPRELNCLCSYLAIWKAELQRSSTAASCVSGCDRPKPGAWNSRWVSHVAAGTQARGPFSRPSLGHFIELEMKHVRIKSVPM